MGAPRAILRPCMSTTGAWLMKHWLVRLTTLLALAEVQYARGKYDQAAQTYAAAGSLRPTEFARHGVQLAQAGGPPALAMASSSGQAKAAALASVATGSASQAGIVVARAAQRDDTIATSLAPTVTGAHSIIDSLFGLAGGAAQANFRQPYRCVGGKAGAAKTCIRSFLKRPEAPRIPNPTTGRKCRQNGRCRLPPGTCRFAPR
mgnify:CR=1 FL=1